MLRRRMAISFAATAALVLAGAAPALAGDETTTIDINSDHLDTTAEEFDEQECDGPFEDLAEDVDGWHFVLPGKGGSFESLSLTFDTPDGEVVAEIESDDSSDPSSGDGWSGYIDPAGKSGADRHAYVFTDAGWTLTAGSAEIDGDHEFFNLSHTCPGVPDEGDGDGENGDGENGKEDEEENGDEKDEGKEEEEDDEKPEVPTEIPAGHEGSSGGISAGTIALIAAATALVAGAVALVRRRFVNGS